MNTEIIVLKAVLKSVQLGHFPIGYEIQGIKLNAKATEWQLMQRKKVISKPTISTLTTFKRVDNVANVAKKNKNILVK